jgi:hypothetical protein
VHVISVQELPLAGLELGAFVVEAASAAKKLPSTLALALGDTEPIKHNSDGFNWRTPFSDSEGQ